jgi:hypothetical protein
MRHGARTQTRRQNRTPHGAVSDDSPVHGLDRSVASGRQVSVEAADPIRRQRGGGGPFEVAMTDVSTGPHEAADQKLDSEGLALMSGMLQIRPRRCDSTTSETGLVAGWEVR